MPNRDERTTTTDSWLRGLGNLAFAMISLWLNPTPDADDRAFDDDSAGVRVGALVLALWTLVGIALGAAVAGVRYLAGTASTGPFAFVMLAPMFLPLLLGAVRLPVRRGPALALALTLGTAVGAVGMLALRSIMEGYWAVYLALAAAALTAATSYGAVARQQTNGQTEP